MRHLVSLGLALGLMLAPGVGQAQEAWPSRSITLIVPYGAGGYTDLIGRMTASYVEKELGKPAVVENRAGGGGIVGTGAVARSAPDGYTWCVAAWAPSRWCRSPQARDCPVETVAGGDHGEEAVVPTSGGLHVR
jgi:tripartite-type tricarboxylate transporter receptor subunit TctC